MTEELTRTKVRHRLEAGVADHYGLPPEGSPPRTILLIKTVQEQQGQNRYGEIRWRNNGRPQDIVLASFSRQDLAKIGSEALHLLAYLPAEEEEGHDTQ